MQNSDDHGGLERALSAMRDVAEYINEVKRDNETLQIMNDVQVRAPGTDRRPGRPAEIYAEATS